jgi:hypothetical protein
MEEEFTSACEQMSIAVKAFLAAKRRENPARAPSMKIALKRRGSNEPVFDGR